jgi:mRNA interferase RelE/StbE
MASYKVVIEARAEKEIRKLPAPERKRVTSVIDKLATNPKSATARKMVGSPGFRLRVGDYRIIYEIEHQIVTVFIIKVGHRRDIYKK